MTMTMCFSAAHTSCAFRSTHILLHVNREREKWRRGYRKN